MLEVDEHGPTANRTTSPSIGKLEFVLLESNGAVREGVLKLPPSAVSTTRAARRIPLARATILRSAYALAYRLLRALARVTVRAVQGGRVACARAGPPLLQAAYACKQSTASVARRGRLTCARAGPPLLQAAYACKQFTASVVRRGRLTCAQAGRLRVRAGYEFRYYQVHLRHSRRRRYLFARRLLETSGLLLFAIIAILLGRGI
jgi:hypothetical protein